MTRLRQALKRPQTLRVIVELEVRAPEEKDLAHLGELGLDVERVIGNKVVGSILAAKLAGLEKDDSVRMVERSEKLGLH
jgi:hypothetical protein